MLFWYNLCAKNLPEDFDNCKCQPDEVNLCVPLYNVETGEFECFEDWLAYIMVRRNENEIFLSYGYDEGKSSRLYSTCNQMLPNIFQDKSFKKHNPMSMDERAVQEYSIILFSPFNYG